MNKELRASLDGKTAAVTRLAARAGAYDGPWITQRVALTDGADALQRAMLTLLPAYTLVLDIIHAIEYLWAAANGRLGERHPDRTALGPNAPGAPPERPGRGRHQRPGRGGRGQHHQRDRTCPTPAHRRLLAAECTIHALRRVPRGWLAHRHRGH